MKKYIYILYILCISLSINAQSVHGSKIKKNKKVIEATQLSMVMGEKKELHSQITGIVESVCQAKGCWMKVTTDLGKSMRVTFKDYAFFVPKDIEGKRVTFEGIAVKKETSIADLKHYAADAGKSPAEISQITEPEYSITFEAEGVIVEK